MPEGGIASFRGSIPLLGMVRCFGTKRELSFISRGHRRCRQAGFRRPPVRVGLRVGPHSNPFSGPAPTRGDAPWALGCSSSSGRVVGGCCHEVSRRCLRGLILPSSARRVPLAWPASGALPPRVDRVFPRARSPCGWYPQQTRIPLVGCPLVSRQGRRLSCLRGCCPPAFRSRYLERLTDS